VAIPVCLGLFDRSGLASNSTPAAPLLSGSGGSAAYNAVEGGFVINAGSNGTVYWKNLQPTAGSPPGSGALSGSGITAINTAWQTMRAYNTSIGNPAPGVGPPYGWTTKLRIECGNLGSGTTNCQPSWLVGSVGDSITNGTITLAPFFVANYLTIFTQFMQTLAAYVPTGESQALASNNLLGELCLCGIATEPFLPTAYGWTQSQLTTANNVTPTASTWFTALENIAQAMFAAFPNSWISTALNPPQIFGSTTGGSATSLFGGAASYVPKFLSYGNAVLENNSLRANAANQSTTIGVAGPFTSVDPNTGVAWYNSGSYADGHGSSYAAMYTPMAEDGQGAFASQVGSGPATPAVPIDIQTATYNGLGNTGPLLGDTYSYGVCLGAKLIEQPAGYNVLTPSQLALYAGPIVVNSTATSTTSTTLTDTSQSWSPANVWAGMTCVAGSSSGVITASTTDKLTVSAWVGGTPSGTAAYVVKWGGIATATSATTLTDSAQSWSTNNWQGLNVVAGTSTGLIASNTGHVLTVVAWVGGTPAANAAYTIQYGLVANNPGQAQAAGQVVQHVQAGTSADSTTLVVANLATTVGNLCVLKVGVRAASAPTASISGGGTWNNRYSVNSGAGTGNMSGWDLVPTGSISANGITITSSQSGSMEYEFWEISGLSATPYENSATATGSTAGATVSITPAVASDVVLGGIFWPNGSSTIGSLPGSPWVNDPTIVGTG